MADAMGIVIVVVVAAAALIAVATAVTSGRTYDRIGHGGLSLRDGSDGGDALTHEPRSNGAAAREREEEIRQLLEARNELRVRHGREPVDVETELRALSAPAVRADPGLEAEIRDLVIARNERRVRRGREPLDVDAEVARRMAELGGA